MSGERRFICVDVNNSEDETRHFGQRIEFSAPSSLYEVHTVALIEEEDDENIVPEATEGKPKESAFSLLKCTNNDEKMVVAVDRFLNFLEIQYGYNFLFTTHISGIESISTLCFLPGTDIIAAVATDAVIYFVSVQYRGIISKLVLSESTRFDKATITITCSLDDYYISVFSGKRCYTVRLYAFREALLVYPSSKGIDEIAERVKKASVDAVDCGISASDLVVLPNLSSNLIVSRSAKDPALLSQIGGSKDSHSCVFPKGICGFIRAKICSDLRLILLLSKDGRIFFFDSATGFFLFERRLLLAGEQAIDFILVDLETKLISLSTKIGLLVEHENKLQFQIRSFDEGIVLYSVVVSPTTLLFGGTVKEDGTVFFAEFFESSRGERDSIRIRSLRECQPEMRLQRLLNRFQFDEAMQLALHFKLDVQQVHKARASYLLTCLDDPENGQETFDAFLLCLEQISEHNWVGETCCSGATLFCRSFEWIVSLLRYAEKRNITDVDTSYNLSRVRYNLATYRMLFGPRKASFEPDSAWSEFVSDDGWEGLFLKFCQQGYAAEARLLWKRYNSTLKPWMERSFDAFFSFLDALRVFISEDKSPEELLEFAQQELLPVVMCAHPQQLSESFFDWLLSYGNQLEALHPEAFPENALNVCLLMERTVKVMISNAVTPVQQAQVAAALAIVRIDTEDTTHSMGRLNAYVRDLREMDKLKKKYECRLSHATYKEQNAEGICHLILKRIRNVALVVSNIKQFAIPYMEEYKLDVDQTLFNYVLEFAKRSASVATNVNPWDEWCLAIAETIGCIGLRCKAVIGIAKKAFPPWTQQLCRAVDFMLNSADVDLMLKVELQEKRDLAQLGQMLIPYIVPFAFLEKLVSHSRYVLSLINFILRQEQVEPELTKRTLDSLKVIDFVSKLKPGLVSRESCYVQCCNYIIGKTFGNDMFTSLIRFINALNDTDRISLARRIISNAVCEADSGISVLTTCDKVLRIAKIDAALCVLERYFTDDVFSQELSAKLRGIKKLQERFGIYVGCKTLDNGTRNDFLKSFLSEGNMKDFSEVFKFAVALTIKREAACVIAANYAIDCREPLLAISYAKFAFYDIFCFQLISCSRPRVIPSDRFGLQCAKEVDEELLDVSVRSCMLGLWELNTLSDSGRIDELFIMVEALAGFSSFLVNAAVPDNWTRPFVFQFSSFMSLFVRLMEQCKIDDDEEMVILGSSISKSVHEDEVTRGDIYGINRRLGVYRTQCDGAIFGRADALRAMAHVARSIIREIPKSVDKDKFYEEMRNSWEFLFNFFSLNNQPYLELCCRSFSAYLPCLYGQFLMQPDQMQQNLVFLCERVLSQYPADLCLLSSALFVPPLSVAEKVLKQLRLWAKSRKSPQVMLNLIRVSQFICICYDNRTVVDQMAHYYAICAWTRRLSKLGGAFPNDVNNEAVVQEFVKARIAVNHVIDFCADFGLDKYEVLLQYALKMAELSATEKDERIACEMLSLSSSAFQLLTVAEDIFSRLYDCMKLLCPYNYAVIELLLMEMKRFAKTEEDCQKAQLLVTLFGLLTGIERVNGPTECEIRWYQERQKFVAQKVSELASNSLLASLTSDSTILNANAASEPSENARYAQELYERPNLLLAKLPSSSRSRLPFHMFLFEDEKDIQNILLPVVNAELTLYNVSSWQQLARTLPHLSISKSRLLSSAVMLAIKGHIQNGTIISQYEIEMIENLLVESANQKGIIDALSEGFRCIPLCETKLCLLEIGIHVAEKWLELSEPTTTLTSATRAYVQYWVERLVPALKIYRTDFLLRKAKLLKEETFDIVKDPEQLIVQIYSKEIDWADNKDKREKLELINRIAAIHGLDLVAIQAKLLEDWLPASTSQSSNFDPNDTDGDVAMSDHVVEEDVVFRLPYMDDSLTRVLHLLNLQDRRQAAIALSAECSKDFSHSTYGTKVRSLCCLLRLCSENELKLYIRNDVNYLCNSIERLLYGRLIEISNVELQLKTFLEKAKPALVRSLLSNNYRQTNQLAYLVSCMVVDYKVVDRVITENILTRLHAVGRREMLVGVLEFCSSYPELSTVRNLAQFWARTSDWMAADIDVNRSAAKTKVHNFLYFCLSCPVEGGRAFGSLCGTVDNFGLPVASQLIRIAVSATSTYEPMVEGSWSPLDLSLGWQKSEA